MRVCPWLVRVRPWLVRVCPWLVRVCPCLMRASMASAKWKPRVKVKPWDIVTVQKEMFCCSYVLLKHVTIQVGRLGYV